MTSAADLAIACGGMLDDALQGRLSHTGQEVLADAVACAARRDLPGGFCWDKTGGSIEALSAATLARWALVAFSKPPRPRSLPPLADTSSGGYRGPAFLDLDRVRF